MDRLPKICRRIAADASTALLLKLVAVPVAYLTPLVIARLYGAEPLGTYALARQLFASLSIFCLLGLDTGLLRFLSAPTLPGPADDRRRLLRSSMLLVAGLSLLMGIALYWLRGYLARCFHAPQLSLMLVFMCLALPGAALSSLCRESLRAMGGVRQAVFPQQVLCPLSFLLLAVVFAGLGPGFFPSAGGLGLAFLLSILIGMLFYGVIIRSYLGNPKPAPRQQTFGRLLRYSLPLFLTSLLLISQAYFDGLILGWFTTPATVAYYEAATKTALLISLPLLAVNAAAPARFAQLYQAGDLKGLELVARSSARWAYFLTLPLAVLFMLLTPQLLGFFGPGFQEAHLALRILIPAHLFNVACGSVDLVPAMTGRPWTLPRAQFLAGMVGLPLTAVAAAYYGLNGVALARGLWLVGLNLLLSLAIRRQLGLKVSAGGVGRAHWGGVCGVGLYFLAAHYTGPLGGTLGFALGYLALAAPPLWREWDALRRESGGPEPLSV